MEGQDLQQPMDFSTISSTRSQHAHRESLSDIRPRSASTSQQTDPQGAMSVPPGPQRMNGNHHPGHMPRLSAGAGYGGGFDMARSPPHDKNTAHVPCKFYRLGKCTYGDACPFEHSMNDIGPAPCKYFAKGNCKFGQKCALAHILPDGRRINGPNHNMDGGHFVNGTGGGRVPHNQFTEGEQGMYRPSNIALQRSAAGQQYSGFAQQQEEPMFLPRVHHPLDPVAPNLASQFDTGYSSHNSKFGSSPPAELKMATSPLGARALDAPLPASFDANGPSNFGRNGFAAASVPTGWLRPSPASPATPLAFGNLNGMTLGDSGRSGFTPASPPSSSLGEGLFAKRAVPITSRSRPKVMAASFDPRDIWSTDVNDDDPLEEDLIPTELGLLTDEEKVRRFSRTDQDSGSRLSAIGSPPGSKVGSPSTASPSRFGAFFARRTESADLGAGGASPFGHVGSPLRKFSMTAETNGLLSASASADAPQHLSSLPQSSGIGLLSQQMNRTRLSVKPELPDIFHTRQNGAPRTTSNTNITPSAGGLSSSRMNRAISSTSVSRDRIDEDIFEMEDEGDDMLNSKRSSYGGPNIWSMTPAEKASPSLGPIGGQRRPSTTVKEVGK